MQKLIQKLQYLKRLYMQTLSLIQTLAYLLIFLQKHIVSFVNSIDNSEKFVLVIEYILLDNLTKLDKMQKFFLNKIRIVFCQILQALVYLYNEKNITYCDIESENILVQFRSPELFIKLCDFGISIEKRFLQILCRTQLYIATEIFIKLYINVVDIWAIEVVNYQFIRNLSSFSKKFDSKKQPKIIRQTIDCVNC